jgi:hypothetical protein
MGERHVFSREGRCKGCGCTSASATAAQQCPLPADTVRHMVGGETGEDECGWAPVLLPTDPRCIGDGYIPGCHTCPAPTPEAP